MRWKDRLIVMLGGTVYEPRHSRVVEVEWHRVEELRPDRLGPSEDDIIADDPGWKTPSGMTRDPFAPTRTLGPLSN